VISIGYEDRKQLTVKLLLEVFGSHIPGKCRFSILEVLALYFCEAILSIRKESSESNLRSIR